MVEADGHARDDADPGGDGLVHRVLDDRGELADQPGAARQLVGRRRRERLMRAPHELDAVAHTPAVEDLVSPAGIAVERVVQHPVRHIVNLSLALRPSYRGFARRADAPCGDGAVSRRPTPLGTTPLGTGSKGVITQPP